MRFLFLIFVEQPKNINRQNTPEIRNKIDSEVTVSKKVDERVQKAERTRNMKIFDAIVVLQPRNPGKWMELPGVGQPGYLYQFDKGNVFMYKRGAEKVPPLMLDKETLTWRATAWAAPAEKKAQEEPAVQKKPRTDTVPDGWFMKSDKQKIRGWVGDRKDMFGVRKKFDGIDFRRDDMKDETYQEFLRTDAHTKRENPLETQKIIIENLEAKKEEPLYIKVRETGERWILAPRKSFAEGIGRFYQTYLLVRVDEKGMPDRSVSSVIHMNEMLFNNQLNEEKLLKCMDESKKTAELEKADDRGEGMKKLADFDLAEEGEPLGYIGIIDKNDFVTYIGFIDHARNFPKQLAGRYNLVCPKGNEDLDLSEMDNPVEVMEKKVEEQYAHGVRKFYLNIYTHGTEAFGETKGKLLNSGGTSVTPEEVLAMTKKFPKAKFTLNTTACYGAGFADEMEKFEDAKDAPAGRVAVILPVKRYLANEFKHTLGTLYQDALSHYLSIEENGKKLTYGEAHRRADRDTKKSIGLDAEIWQSNPGKPPIYSAKNTPKKKGEGDSGEKDLS